MTKNKPHGSASVIYSLLGLLMIVGAVLFIQTRFDLAMAMFFATIVFLILAVIRAVRAKKEAKAAPPPAPVKPRPVERGYYRESLRVAGAYYHQAEIESIGQPNDDYALTKKQLLEDFEGERVYELYFNPIVKFVPDPDNEHDSSAIRIEADGALIGYVPHDKTQYVRELMDAGRIKSLDVEIEGGKYKLAEDDEVERGEDDYSVDLTMTLWEEAPAPEAPQTPAFDEGVSMGSTVSPPAADYHERSKRNGKRIILGLLLLIAFLAFVARGYSYQPASTASLDTAFDSLGSAGRLSRLFASPSGSEEAMNLEALYGQRFDFSQISFRVTDVYKHAEADRAFLVYEFTWTNRGHRAIDFSEADVQLEAYQDGVACDYGIVTGVETNNLEKILPNASLVSYLAVELRGSGDVETSISEAYSFAAPILFTVRLDEIESK